MNTDNESRPYTPPLITSFKRSEIAMMSPEEYKANRNQIIKAQKAGLIEDDLAISPARNGNASSMVQNQDGTLTVLGSPEE